jgi:hypothetical protein
MQINPETNTEVDIMNTPCIALLSLTISIIFKSGKAIGVK